VVQACARVLQAAKSVPPRPQIAIFLQQRQQSVGKIGPVGFRGAWVVSIGWTRLLYGVLFPFSRFPPLCEGEVLDWALILRLRYS
jgi:hypothetical protein